MTQKLRSPTFEKYDRVNGRSYKQVRSQPSIGPKPSVNTYFTDDELKAGGQRFKYDDSASSDGSDFYGKGTVQELLDSDGMDAREAGMMAGYLS